MNLTELHKETLYLIYDGDCIFCRNSAKAIKIKKLIGKIELVNAREPHPIVKDALDQGYKFKSINRKYT